jgi:IMP cyclohydrolase
VLSARQYPGRGCLAVRTSTGELGLVYFLTGRSAASRSRKIVPAGSDLTIRDSTGAGADELRHYVAAARRGNWIVVGNGAQVEPLATALAEGRGALDAWSDHTFEPDPPLFTSRVWAAHEIGGQDCLMGFARRSERTGGGTDRVVWAVDELAAGTGILMTTYCGTVKDVISTPAPADVAVTSLDLATVLHDVWQSLDPRLRVAAFAVSADDPARAPIVVPYSEP